MHPVGDVVASIDATGRRLEIHFGNVASADQIAHQVRNVIYLRDIFHDKKHEIFTERCHSWALS